MRKNLPIITDRSMHSSLPKQQLNQISDPLETIKQLQHIIIQQEKEIRKLQKMNEYLQKSNASKLEMLNFERSSKIKPMSKLITDQSINNSSTFIKTHNVRPVESPNQNTSRSTQSSIKKGTIIRTTSPLRKKTNFISLQKVNIQNLEFEEENAARQAKLDFTKEKQKKAQNILGFLQVDECFKINAILNMNLQDSDSISLYENDGTLSLMKELLKDEENFIELLMMAGPQKLSFLYEKTKRVYSEHKMLFFQVLRLKKIIYHSQAAQSMSQTLLLDEALTTIVNEIISCLECDRASCFIVDHQKNEIWSKVAKGTQATLRFPIGKGIAGHVAQSKEMLNIQNAYLDQRFNQDYDIQNNYKTKSLLVCPIIDKDKCIGVLQCINKNEGLFTKDDEALINILAEFSRIVLKNAINHDEQLLIHNKLRHTIKTGLLLQKKCNSSPEFFIIAMERLKSVLNIEKSQVVLLSKDREKLIFYTEKLERKEVNIGIGIIGHSIMERQKLNLFNCYKHPLFNPIIDLDTSMPVVIQPIIYKDEILGAIEVINVKGFATLFQNILPKVTAIDQEVLDFFVQQCGQAIKYLNEI